MGSILVITKSLIIRLPTPYLYFCLDTDPPQFTATPTDITQNTDVGMPTATVTWTPPTITDNWGAAQITEVKNYLPGDVFPIGVTTVDYTATDCTGNQQTFSLSVTINGKYHLTSVLLQSVIMLYIYKGIC